ncbi:type I DNA topoisomerase [Dethiobacter alkaliphilus]|uniref:DNA topoisomerase 1 n=1 Tax=Dethiobacter alkaliphilus AHT 1 TaxID=555088 RepID=C0GIT5_DETAL|nr:type I DNA topoisomerase [Dethiobacter alkaliphilus]EEG76749.1 DNA topoisomerase I [Dethiobacter alkaliphilus AHT 1]
MSDYLVVVESPTKAKTIKKYLGKRYKVVASMGHVIDLPKSQFAIDIENDFTPKYITIRGKGDVLKELKSAAKSAKKVFLAADPDREGEAICWHLSHALKIEEDAPCRVEFNEITEKAVKEAFKKPRLVDKYRVDAQQARRVLDRLVGYKISPLLWKKVKKGLSAGRVQSVALRLIVEREDEIERFVPEEYWSLEADLQNKDKSPFKARYTGKEGKKHVPSTKEEVDELLSGLKDRAFTVEDVRKKERRRRPSPPFTTSSLQQEASRKLGFTTRKTMMLAQQLYEGLKLGKEVVGLITYIRTDATRVAPSAQDEARQYITEKYGKPYLPSKPPVYTSKKGAQEAHEAIRPTAVEHSPEKIKESLSRDQLRLYRLIWDRFVASQMSPAVYDTVAVDIAAGPYNFRANGSQIKFDGFMKLYIEGKDEEEKEEGGLLPELAKGEELTLLELEPEQHFTQPPPRFSEAMLVKTLEEKGIGRPSTYAPIIGTLQTRGYVTREKKVFYATELGRVVLEQLLEFFPDILDAQFTAQMEEKLDIIAEGKLDWVDVIRDFYQDFAKSLKVAEEHMETVVITPEESDEECPKCGRTLVYKMGRYGKFLACPGFPDCRFAKPIIKELDVPCPTCNKPLVERKTKRGRIFYGCSGYPECEFTTWDVPQKDKCPRCGYLTVLKGKTLQCADKECGEILSGPPPKEKKQGKKGTAKTTKKEKVRSGKRG